MRSICHGCIQETPSNTRTMPERRPWPSFSQLLADQSSPRDRRLFYPRRPSHLPNCPLPCVEENNDAGVVYVGRKMNQIRHLSVYEQNYLRGGNIVAFVVQEAEAGKHARPHSQPSRRVTQILRLSSPFSANRAVCGLERIDGRAQKDRAEGPQRSDCKTSLCQECMCPRLVCAPGRMD